MNKFFKQLWKFIKKNPLWAIWNIFWSIPAVLSLMFFCIFVSIKDLDYREFSRIWGENM